MKKIITALLFLTLTKISFADIHIYPTNWWVSMKMNKIQLLIRSDDVPISQKQIRLNYPGIQLIKKNELENKRYIALDIIILPTANPGTVYIQFLEKGKKIQTISWELKARRNGNGVSYAQGVTSSDFIYLIMPDRFSNGDESNDKFPDMNDTSSNRNNPFLRHGGDLQGVINHLDYFNNLGATALWLTPVIENNTSLSDENGTKRSSYHGYHFTDQYKIDKRFGGNEGYKEMINAAHAKGLKIIQDAVYNHAGNKHFLFLDPPGKDWFNEWPEYTNSSYRDQPLIDAYASKYDYEHSVSGWFTPFLPDVNQRNPFMQKFLIQHAIWTVEEFGIDGWRVDTYFYSDRDFLNDVNEALYTEYPHISIFGETTMQSVTEQAYYMQNNLNVQWKSNLQGVTDYQWWGSVLAGLNEKFGWSNGIMRLYNTLVQDILYQDPMRNEIFLDNHDQNRFYSVVDEDFNKYKQGITLLLTQRGIPQLYYGTEILMKNFMDPTDAEVRKDFPGGFTGDKENKFETSGRTEKENEAFNFVSTLANFRKKSSAIKTGKFMQYVPQDGVYVYFRYNAQQTIMCIINTADEEKQIDMLRFTERTAGFGSARYIETHKTFNSKNKFRVPAHESYVLELVK